MTTTSRPAARHGADGRVCLIGGVSSLVLAPETRGALPVSGGPRKGLAT
ncbi:hypothetical protein [Amycolatopsis ultiminotia]